MSEPITWITKNGKHIPIYADESDDSKRKEKQIMDNEHEAKQIAENEDTSWRLTHRPGNPLKYPDEVATVDKITNGNYFPKDILQRPDEYLPDFEDFKDARKVLNILKQAQGNPNMQVTIYRGAPSGGKLHKGDWVTFSKDYAEQYAGGGKYSDNVKSQVYEYKVRVGDLSFDGDSFWEYGYWGNSMK